MKALDLVLARVPHDHALVIDSLSNVLSQVLSGFILTITIKTMDQSWGCTRCCWARCGRSVEQMFIMSSVAVFTEIAMPFRPSPTWLINFLRLVCG